MLDMYNAENSVRNTQTLCCLCNNSVNLDLCHILMVDTVISCIVFKTHRMYNIEFALMHR